MKILFVDINDAESASAWSGTTSRILDALRRKHEVFLLDNLNKFIKALFLPYVAECKLTKKKYQLDRHEAVAKCYANQVIKAYKFYKPCIVFSVSTIPIAYLPEAIPSACWTDAVMPDMVDFYWPAAEYHWRSLADGIRLDELAVRKNRASIFSSQWAADGARRLVPGASRRIFTVPFGANTYAVRPGNKPRLLPELHSARINFLFVGADWERKGGQDCIDAVKILRSNGCNAHLSTVGARPLTECEQSEFVLHYGYLRRDVEEECAILRRLYDEAHFFILPTHAECSPIVLAEAASHGLPVISRDVGGVSSMVARDLNSVLIQRDEGPNALAEAIRPILADKDRYRAMSSSSLKLYADELNWATAVSNVSMILERAVSKL